VKISDDNNRYSLHKRADKVPQEFLVALIQPLESIGKISFEELFNLDDIQQLQDEFAEATGVASIITHPDGTPITAPSNFSRLCSDVIRKTEKGCANCFKSDALIGALNPNGPTIQPCMSGGLWDAGAGIEVDGQHIANWLIGQVRDETQTEKKMRTYAKEIGADEEEVVKAFREVPSMSQERFKKISQMLFTLSQQLSKTAFQNVVQARLITEQEQAEKELADTKEFLDSIINGIADPIFVKDNEHRWIALNDSFCHMMGFSRAELLGKSDYDFCPKEQADIFWAKDSEILNSNHVISNEEEINCLQETRTISTVKSSFINPVTGKKNLVGTIRDITEKKRLNKELDVHRHHLEKLVEERTSELNESLEHLLETKNQLVESEKMASLGRLVAGIAHELNTPIGICVTAASFLLAEIKNITKTLNNGDMSKNEFVEFLNALTQSASIIESNLNRAVSQINNFKMVAVDVSSEMPRSFLFQEYISQLKESLHHELKRSNHQLNIECDSKLSIESYPGALTQAITIMVMNSIIHAYDEGESGHLLIAVTRQNEMVHVTYSDDGHGMAPKTVNQVFEPFYTTNRGSGGSGLGMHILYNLVTQTLSGEVKCDSELGKGVVITISFPVKLN